MLYVHTGLPIQGHPLGQFLPRDHADFRQSQQSSMAIHMVCHDSSLVLIGLLVNSISQSVSLVGNVEVVASTHDVSIGGDVITVGGDPSPQFSQVGVVGPVLPPGPQSKLGFSLCFRQSQHRGCCTAGRYICHTATASRRLWYKSA